MKLKLAIGIGGSSGANYAKVLLNSLKSYTSQIETVGIVASDNAMINWDLEVKDQQLEDYGWKIFGSRDFMAPFASGSAGYDAMIICPCSMGVLGRIAGGYSDDLMTRGADVMLKERKKLVLVIRETPFNLIHIRNMETVTLAGGIICPAIPSFYSEPNSLDEILSTVTDRALQLAGIQIKGYRWGE